jgi:hypothetical protein
MGMKTGWPQRVQGMLSKGGRSAGIKIFTRQAPHSTIFSGLRSDEVSAALTFGNGNITIRENKGGEQIPASFDISGQNYRFGLFS